MTVQHADASATSLTLMDLHPGDLCRVQLRDLERPDRALLGALGLGGRSPLRLCKTGNPCIVEVRGTRIGLAEAVARRLRVVPEVQTV